MNLTGVSGYFIYILFGSLLGSALKCYATWEDTEADKKGHDLIECPVITKEGGQNEVPTSCGKMTDAGGINLYCGYDSLLKQHGVPAGKGCAEDVYSEDGSPITMEIWYCVNDGCNKNCICSMEKPDSGPKPISQPQTDTSTTDKSSAFSRTTQSGSSSSMEAPGLVVMLIVSAMFIRFSISE